ncbi:MAG: alpha/beta-type small acid-soluble spore protein [Clostridiales bacterium]|nr:alpha/beta-type small acid-soluble spore protein [Clostridiales bacterium]
MAQGSGSNVPVKKQAAQALDRFKYEVAQELGIQPPQSGYWGELPARVCGAVGGHMVKKMIEQAEQQLAGRG